MKVISPETSRLRKKETQKRKDEEIREGMGMKTESKN